MPIKVVSIGLVVGIWFLKRTLLVKNLEQDFLPPELGQLCKNETSFYYNSNFALFPSGTSYLEKTDKSCYVIGRILFQEILDSWSRWYLVVFFFPAIIPAKTWYKTHNRKFLVIVKAIKPWRHYLKNCKYEIFVFIDCNNLCPFIDS